jgi:hypothetical protein
LDAPTFLSIRQAAMGGEDDVPEDDEAVNAGVISHRRAAENMHHA